MSADIFKRGSILRLETVTGKVYYCMWRSGTKALYQYRKGKWLANKKGEKIVAKKSEQWYDVLTANMKESFTVSEVRHEDFISVLRQDTDPDSVVPAKKERVRRKVSS